MRSVKRGFGGSFTVLEDGVQIGDVFKGPGAKERAEALAQAEPAVKVNAVADEREYWARVNAVLGAPVAAEMAEHKAVFAKYHDADTVRLLMSILEPAVKAGKQARRRGRRANLLPAAQVAA